MVSALNDADESIGHLIACYQSPDVVRNFLNIVLENIPELFLKMLTTSNIHQQSITHLIARHQSPQLVLQFLQMVIDNCPETLQEILSAETNQSLTVGHLIAHYQSPQAIAFFISYVIDHQPRSLRKVLTATVKNDVYENDNKRFSQGDDLISIALRKSPEEKTELAQLLKQPGFKKALKFIFNNPISAAKLSQDFKKEAHIAFNHYLKYRKLDKVIDLFDYGFELNFDLFKRVFLRKNISEHQLIGYRDAFDELRYQGSISKAMHSQLFKLIDQYKPHHRLEIITHKKPVSYCCSVILNAVCEAKHPHAFFEKCSPESLLCVFRRI